jgi:hypothetical protein
MEGKRIAAVLLASCIVVGRPVLAIETDLNLSEGRQPDPTAKALAEIRAADYRSIPLDVMLKTSAHYVAGGPVIVTVVITNLFDPPLLLNSRMLVNHPRLEGEVSFYIADQNGRRLEINRLITPLSVRNNDFVTLTRGESIQRSVDLADLYDLTGKGTYKIWVSYHNEMDVTGKSERAWKGFVLSDPIDISLE